jgi:hypothetical protein
MRQLNHAWEVLGEPARRRLYDRSLLVGDDRGDGPPQEAGGGVSFATDAAPPPLARLLRPSVLILVVLLVIFTVTAYAGRGLDNRNRPTPSPSAGGGSGQGAGGAPAGGAPAGGVPAGGGAPTGGGATGVSSGPATSGGEGASSPDTPRVGDCLRTLPGDDTVVPCAGAEAGRVVSLAPTISDCPAGTDAHRLTGRGGVACLAPSAP